MRLPASLNEHDIQFHGKTDINQYEIQILAWSDTAFSGMPNTGLIQEQTTDKAKTFFLLF